MLPILRSLRPVLITLLFIALWTGGTGPACTTGHTPTQTAAAPPAKASTLFLWTTKSKTATVHLLGSVHVGNEELYPLDPRIEAAFRASDVLVLEVDMDDEAMANAAVQMTEAALLPKGENLDDLINDETRRLLKEKLARLEMLPAQVQMFKPWFVAMTITMREIEAAGFDAELGLEQHFLRSARGTKQVLSLESIEEQLAAIQAYTDDVADEALRQALETDSAAYLASMLDAWRQGDTERLDRMLDEARKYPDSYQVMFTNRNLGMANKVEAYLRSQKTYFVVAGAGHMVGKDSVVDLLRRRGHRVIQAR